MSWLIVGTIPEQSFPLVCDHYIIEKQNLIIQDLKYPINRGTPALLASTFLAAQVLDTKIPRALLAGDIGNGHGSTKIYNALVHKDCESLKGLTFHYLMPDIEGHNKVFWHLKKPGSSPLLVADAGFMYVAKMSGFASDYDLFTPDAGEMAFLADEQAPHPFYTRGFLLQEEDKIPPMIKAAYQHGNAAKHLLVKGHQDFIVALGEIMAVIDFPSTETMEPIGGTGDTITGMVTALLASGKSMVEACYLAALANRYLGVLGNPTPATSVADLLDFLPQALEQALNDQHSHST